jgi:hypothetical protein
VRRSEFDTWIGRYRQVGHRELDRLVTDTLEGL